MSMQLHLVGKKCTIAQVDTALLVTRFGVNTASIIKGLVRIHSDTPSNTF